MEQQNQYITNPAVWFEIYVDDINRARKFYEAVLNLQLQEMLDPSDQGLKMFTFPMHQGAPNAGGSLVQMQGVKAGGNSTIIYFGSVDCAIEEARVEQAGGKVFKAKMSIGEYGFMSLCYDTEGNMFGLFSMQ